MTEASRQQLNESGSTELHEEVGRRLAAVDQRFTAGRRGLVEVLATADGPLSVPDIIAAGSSLPQSSVYRNLSVLMEAGVVRRVVGTDEHARFELAEDLAGDHHHHLLCLLCGSVFDVSAAPRLERALSEAARLAAEEVGFEVTEHRIDLVGVCSNCR